jgi:hypothetical protein
VIDVLCYLVVRFVITHYSPTTTSTTSATATIEELIRLLRDPTPKVREHAAEAMALLYEY